MSVLVEPLNHISDKLRNLEDGNVLDVSNLTEDAVNLTKNFYSNYSVFGPIKDNKNSKPGDIRYVLAFIKKGELQNA